LLLFDNLDIVLILLKVVLFAWFYGSRTTSQMPARASGPVLAYRRAVIPLTVTATAATCNAHGHLVAAVHAV